MFEAAVATGAVAMPLKLPGPDVGTAEQAAPNGAEAALAVMSEEELEDPPVGAMLEDDDAAEAAAVLLVLLLHALALTAMTAEHSRAAAVLLRGENMFSSLIERLSGSC
ncbi:hypothetical protein GCM10009838_24750 [Catenulispora subtropica]|uniref:Uncharacterized protein n=1 Tax=Catenulispora subtropica TaxID=450798 RepID=A0ABN2RAE4_9ACTN